MRFPPPRICPLFLRGRDASKTRYRVTLFILKLFMCHCLSRHQGALEGFFFFFFFFAFYCFFFFFYVFFWLFFFFFFFFFFWFFFLCFFCFFVCPSFFFFFFFFFFFSDFPLFPVYRDRDRFPKVSVLSHRTIFCFTTAPLRVFGSWISFPIN